MSNTISDLTAGESVLISLAPFETDFLLVRVDGFEAEIYSNMGGIAAQTGSRVRIPYLRAVPLVHVIDLNAENRPSEVVLTPEKLTRNAKIDVTSFELPIDTNRDKERIEAYRAFEAATQSTDDESPGLWRSRAELFEQAAAGFKRAGDDEPRLWAEYLNAYIHYFPLAEYDRAARMSRDIQKQASKHGFRAIELMATQLEGQALIERSQGDNPDEAREKAEEGQMVLARAASLAAGMNYQYEQAFAINSRGIGYFYQGHLEEAMQFYEQALAMALDLEDLSLERQVRGNLALVHERQGDLYGALDELKAINEQLLDSDALADLAHNFSEISRLYQRLHLIPEAVNAQEREYELWRQLNSAEGLGRAGLSLAYSYYAMGNAAHSLVVLREAIEHLTKARYARGLRDGYELLAIIHRGVGQYQEMNAARVREADYLTSERHRARYHYQKGLDFLAQHSGRISPAVDDFLRAEMLAESSGEESVRLLAQLHRCAIVRPSTTNCLDPDFWEALTLWLPFAPPSQAFEANYLQAQYLNQLGQETRAWEIMDSLISDILLYRRTLPGVLGAWYWQGRARIFEFYMQLSLRESGDPRQRASRSLLALNRLVNTSLASAMYDLPSPAGEPGDIREIRILLAQLEAGEVANGLIDRRDIDRRLLQLDQGTAKTSVIRDEENLQAVFKGLPKDSAFLAYHMTEHESWAWLANVQGVRLFSLGSTQELKSMIHNVRTGLRVVGNDRLNADLRGLGDLLLAPFGGELSETVFHLSAGPIAGIPFDALRTDDGFVGQKHSIINVLSLEALGRKERNLKDARDWQNVLLAGDPLQPGADMSSLPSASRELDKLAGLFEGRHVSVAKGGDLDAELFMAPEFGNAEIIHIASHARNDLEYPELSRLMVSSRDGTEAFLTPLDLRGLPLAAELVVLSACETSGVNTFSFDSNLGFVSAFFNSGAKSILATHWPVSDTFAADFMLGFYAAMLQGTSPPAALAQVKSRNIANQQPGGSLDWSAFQIYIN